MKLAIISRYDSPNTLDLIDSAKRRGFGYQVYQIGDLAFDVENLSDSDFFSHDIYLVRGYNKNLVFAQAIVQELQNRGKRVVDSRLVSGHIPTKFYESIVYKSNAIAHIPTFIAGNSSAWKKLNPSVDYPVIVKDVASQKGKGVRLCQSQDDLLAELDQYGFGVIVQKFMPISFDVRVLCIGDKIIGAIKRQSGGDDFRTNVSLGGTATKYNLSDSETSLALKAHLSMGYEISGVDIAHDASGEPFVIETNIAPEWQGFQQATGINVADKIIDYVMEGQL